MFQRKTSPVYNAAAKKTAVVKHWFAFLLAFGVSGLCPVHVKAGTTPPADISDLVAEPFQVSSQTRLSWTAPGDDGDSGTAASYEIRYSSYLPFVTDSFETGLGDWQTGGDNGASAWTVDPSTYSAGTQSVKAVSNGAINSNSWIKRRVEGPFTLTFDWRVDSEQGADYLKFLVDDTVVDSINGTTAWQSKSYSVAAGSHTIEWRYTKDYAISVNSDTGWLDNVVYREFWNYSTLWKAARAVGGAAGTSEVEVATGAPTYRFLPNTTYYFGIKTRDEIPNWSSMSDMASTVTYAAVPSSAAGGVFTPVYATSVTVNWSSGSVANGGYNPAGTFFNLELSTSSADFTPLVQSTRTSDLSALLTGFEPNTTYYARVNAENSNGISSGYAVLGPTLTLAAVPGYPAVEVFGDVYVSSLTVNWSSGTADGGYNPAGTLFEAQLSSSPVFSTVFVTSKTYNLSATLGGLSPDTVYYARARAMNYTQNWSDFIVLASTLTLAAMPDTPLAPDPVYKPVYASSMTVYWSSGSAVNGGYNPSGTLYTIEVSVSSTTFSPQAGYAQTANVYSAFTGLTPNTTYYSRVRAQNSAGTLTDYKLLGSTVTLAIVPALTGGDAVTPVYATSATVQWLSGSVANGGWNPTGTLYKAEASVSSTTFSPVAASSQTANLSAVLSGLTPDTTYYARVRALNRIGVATAFTVLGSTVTPAVMPDIPPSGDAFIPVYASSMTVNWSSGSVTGGYNPSGTPYRIELSTSSPDFYPVFQSSQTYNINAGFTALTPNTTYYSRAQALGLAGFTEFKALGSTLTAAAVPGQPAGDLFTPIYSSSLTVNWSSGSAAGGYNPAGTRYQAELSTSSPDFTPVAQSSQTYNLNAGLAGLTANTTYYARVQALNSAGSVTIFTVLGSTSTLAITPALPAGDVFTPVYASSLTVSWSSGSVVNGGYNSADTPYKADISTSPGFSPVSDSSQTYNLNAGFEALAPNTTYYARVQALNGIGGGTDYAPLGSTATLAVVPDLPAGAVCEPVYASSLTVNWSSGSVITGYNSADTLYNAEVSTSADFIPAAQSLGAYGLNAVFTALTPDTTYYSRVRAVNFGGIATDFAVFGTTLTLAALPGFPEGAVFTAVYYSSMTVNWSSGSVAGGYNPAGALYRAEVSTSADFNPVLDSSQTYNLDAGFTGLDLNTMYYARAQAFNSAAAASDFTALGSISTLAVKPASPAGPVYELVYASSMTVNWSSGSLAGGYNPDGTLYNVELATSTLFSAIAKSSQTAGLSAVLTALTPNTRYYSRVQALNGSGIGTDFEIFASTLMLAAAPAPPAGDVFTPIYAASMTVNWSSGTSAGGYNPAGTFYRVEVSTSGADFTPAADWTQTSALSALLSGLGPNTTYYARVRAQNSAGEATEFAVLGSTSTMTITPALPAGAAYQPVYVTSMTVNWSSGSVINGGYNPAGTLYKVEVSTSSPDFAPVAKSSQTYNLNVMLTGLAANTTYYARVAGINNIGTLSSYLAPPAGATSPYPPGNYASPVANLAGDSFRLRWTENGNPAGTYYAAQYSTAANFTGSGDGTVIVTSTYSDLGGLTGNTTYYARACAAGHNGASSQFNTAVSTLTFPRPPASASFGAVSSSGVTVNWGAGPNNTTGLAYLAQLSASSLFDTVESSATANVSADYGLGGQGSPLTPNTTYYARVQGLGYSGAGLFADLGSTVTLANVPFLTAALAVTSRSVSLDWLPNGNPEPGTDYEIWRGTESQFLNPVKAASSVSGLLVDGLAVSSTYYFKVRAVNKAGVFSDFDLTFSTRTRPVPPAAITLSGTALGISSINWTWNDAAVEEVYRMLTSTDGNLSGNLPADTLSWLENTGLSPGTAYARKVAVSNPSGTSSSTAVTRYTLAAAPTGSQFVSVWQSSAVVQWAGNSNSTTTLYETQYWAAGGSTTSLNVYLTSVVLTGLSQGTTVSMRVRAVNGDSVPTAYDSIISTFVPATEGIVAPGGEYTITYNQISLDISRATFDETVTVVMQSPPSPAPADNGGLTSLATPILVDVSALNSLLQKLQPLKHVEITIDYQALDLTGVNENALVIATYNTARALWVPLYSERDALAKKITAKTDHFSVFQLMQSIAGTAISGATVGPNPIRPVRNPDQQFVFRNLPSGAGVKIYTCLGELVYETTADANKMAAWNGKNKAGRLVASEIYLALIQWKGEKKVFKLVVER
ncbi:MAG: fibronectin type III domain-containing protein [Elusimicrobia bacterium]|nr:fibronectin type III domain-containing protein [Elusimicrobiota bacterium]